VRLQKYEVERTAYKYPTHMDVIMKILISNQSLDMRKSKTDRTTDHTHPPTT